MGMTNPYDTIIIGGGISGLSLAWRLCESGQDVVIIESSPCVGGLAGTQSGKGYHLDFGPHSFFSEDTEILNCVLGLFDYTLSPKRRKARLYFQGRYLSYPLTPGDVLAKMGLIQGIRMGLSYFKEKIFSAASGSPVPAEEMTVEDWALSSFGAHLYRSFFKPYTEQFWKMPCTELSADSIPSHTRLNFINALKVMSGRPATSHGDSMIERERLPFYYPPTGFGEIASRISDKILRAGGKILLNSRACEAIFKGNHPILVRYRRGGESESIECTRLISTIPLPMLVKMLRPQPPADVLALAAELRFRSLLVLGIVTGKMNVLDGDYMYVLDRPYNRISEMNRFSPETSPPSENIIAVEMPCAENSPLWNASKEDIFRITAPYLAGDGILSPVDARGLLLVKAPHAYPIYEKGYAPRLKMVLDHVRSRPRLETLGRSGEFLYLDADACMRRAFDLSKRFRENTNEVRPQTLADAT